MAVTTGAKRREEEFDSLTLVDTFGVPDFKDPGDLLASKHNFCSQGKRRSARRQVTANSTEERFKMLAQAWRRDAQFISSVTEMAMHPAYQQIIGMGREALPLILRELWNKQDHWFWALKAISGGDPVPPEHQGKLDKMTEIWLHWGKQNRYI